MVSEESGMVVVSPVGGSIVVCSEFSSFFGVVDCEFLEEGLGVVFLPL